MDNNEDYIEENGKLIPLSLVDKFIENGLQEIDVDAIEPVKEWRYTSTPVDYMCIAM